MTEKGWIDNGYWGDGAPVQGVRIDSAGHIFAGRGRTIHRPNGRENWLLFYVASGEETFYFGSRRETVGAGGAVLFAPGEEQYHRCERDGTSEFYYVHFTDLSGDWRPMLPMQSSTPFYTPVGGRLVFCFQGIIDELQLARPFFREIAVAKLTELFLSLRRRAEGGEGGTAARERDIHRAIHDINRTYREELSLEDYARRFGLSKFHFLRLFKQKTGLSPVAYRNMIRLRHAREMLEEGDLAVAEIAAAVGFSSARYFSEAFRAETGESPAHYRKARRG